MFSVRPHGTVKAGFDLVDGTGATVGSLAGSAWREGGRITVGAQEYEFRKSGGGRFARADPGGAELASAERTSWWTGSWRITAGGRTYELVKPSLWRSAYELTEGGRYIGTLDRHGFFRTRAEVTLPPEQPPAVLVFLVGVVMVQWRRDQAAAAS